MTLEATIFARIIDDQDYPAEDAFLNALRAAGLEQRDIKGGSTGRRDKTVECTHRIRANDPDDVAAKTRKYLEREGYTVLEFGVRRDRQVEVSDVDCRHSCFPTQCAA